MRYFAFISFQNADAREALKIQRQIESYRLPAVLLRKNRELPRRIRPTFCYLNDMHHTEELMQELKQRMEQSRYLIVVCSPNSAHSAYVNAGIDYFVSLGRRNCIIPVIVSGVPYSNDEQECFPEALRRHFPRHADPLQDHSILGINMHEAGVGRHKSEQRAMLMIVARMLELDFEGLHLREQQRRRKRTFLATSLSLLMVGALGLTWFSSQTVDVNIQVYEATPHNEALPPCTDIVLRLYVDKEQKTDTIAAFGETSVLHHIPPRYIGKEMRVTLSAKDYQPLDTIITLQREMSLPLRRDADIYGHIRFRIIGQSQPLRIAGQTVVPNADGIVELMLPIEEQRTSYAVEWEGGQDTIYMPCGEDDVMEMERSIN